MTDKKCKAITKNNEPCYRKALIGDYCTMHWIVLKKNKKVKKND